MQAQFQVLERSALWQLQTLPPLSPLPPACACPKILTVPALIIVCSYRLQLQVFFPSLPLLPFTAILLPDPVFSTSILHALLLSLPINPSQCLCIGIGLLLAASCYQDSSMRSTESMGVTVSLISDLEQGMTAAFRAMRSNGRENLSSTCKSRMDSDQVSCKRGTGTEHALWRQILWRIKLPAPTNLMSMYDLQFCKNLQLYHIQGYFHEKTHFLLLPSFKSLFQRCEN